MSDDVLQQLLDWVQGHFFGKYRGVVTDNEDPASVGRLKVKVPAVLGDVEVWAMPCVPYAGDQVGFWFIPEPGTGVWVEFEGGDPSSPIWAGCFWGDGQVPQGADVGLKVLETATMLLTASDDDSEIVLERKNGGAKQTMTDTLVAVAGDSKLDLAGSDATLSQGQAQAKVGSGAVDLNNGAFKVI